MSSRATAQHWTHSGLVGRPKVALRLIADSYDRDWTASSVRELLDFLDVDHIVTANPDQPPWQVITGPGFSEVGKDDIPYKWLGEPQLALHYTGWFTQALLWGVLHGQEGRAALDTDRRLLEERAGRWKERGLDVSPDTWASNKEEAFRVCGDLVKSFEAERDSLSEAPIVLSEEPRIARALAQDD